MVNVDRATPMLLPPDLREWVPADDMVHFVIEAVDSMDLATLSFNRRGCGSEQYPPKMMLCLLIYCYANGIFSSRRIERATWNHLAVRYLTGDTHPDHDTICKFRRENFAAVQEAFIQMLQLARRIGVLKIGTVSIDGTHIKANASKARNVRYGRAGELNERLKAEIAALMKKAEEVDQRESDDGQRLPQQIAHRTKLREQIQQARADMESRARARAEEKRAEYEQKLEAYRLCKAQKRWGGPQRKPVPPREGVKPDESINLTDSDSRAMRKNQADGFEQCYNAQATVDADGSMLILTTHVITAPADFGQLEIGVENVDPSLGEVKTALADAGYLKAESLERLKQRGIDTYVAVTRDQNFDSRRLQYGQPPNKPERDISTPIVRAMRDKLNTTEGQETYRKRRQSVEPAFGIIKSVIGFRQFHLRGLPKVSGEWSLVGLAYNTKRLWRLKQIITN
jgi:transposase